MFKTFILSFKIRLIYVINNFVYSLKQLPVIGKDIPSECYSSDPLKILGLIFAILKEIFWEIIAKKTAYFFTFLILIPSAMQTIILGKEDNLKVAGFAITFILLSLIGGLINNEMFKTSKDKYYAIFTMRINAKNYTISNYIYYLIKVLISFVLLFLIFNKYIIDNIPTYVLLLLPFIMVNIKLICANIRLKYFKRTKNPVFIKSAEFIKNLIITIAFVGAYGFTLIGVQLSTLGLLIIFVLSLILGVISFIQILKFDNYRMMYKKIFAEENKVKIDLKDLKQGTKESMLKQIKQEDVEINSDKTGYAFFNELFVKRHRGLLEKKAKIQTIILLIIALVVLIATQIPMFEQFKQAVNKGILISFPFMAYLMFFLNNGTIVTQAMFMNCDHSMLTYKFYRKPNVILGLFKERLKTLISIDIVPAFVIAVSLPILLFATGGSDNYFNYILLFVATISMSIFFSTHYLVIYYLIQPYNKESEMKSSTYRIIVALTYIIFYSLMKLKLPTILFGSIITIAAILYVFISLTLVYKFAPKTFKIRK